MRLPIPQFIVNWLWRRAQARPAGDIYGDDGSLYMRRWWLVHYDSNRWGIGVRLHLTMRSDQDLEMHDHPWSNISVVLSSPGYWEEMPPTEQDKMRAALGEASSIPTEAYTQVILVDGAPRRMVYRWRGSVVFRRATDWHRLRLVNGKPVLSLFIMGPYRQRWGFLLADGTKRPWREQLSWRAYRKTLCGLVKPADGGAPFCTVCHTTPRTPPCIYNPYTRQGDPDVL